MSDVYKIECIDEQHAIIAALSIREEGDKAIRLGKAILTDAAMTRNVPDTVSSAMAFTREPTKSDMQIWSESE